MSLENELRALVRDVILNEAVPMLVREMDARLKAALDVAPKAGATEVLTVAEFAAALKVSDATVHGWIQARRIDASKLPGGREYRIRRAELDRLLSPAAKVGVPVPEDEATRLLSSLHRKLQSNGGR